MEIYRGSLEPGAKDKFSGEVWLKRFDHLPEGSARVFALHFTAGSRTHWHAHTGRQVMYAIFGRGCVQRAGKDPVLLEPGDVVYLEPGAKHWHGAAPDTDFVHTNIAFDRETHWTFRQETGKMAMEVLTDATYLSCFDG